MDSGIMGDVPLQGRLSLENIFGSGNDVVEGNGAVRESAAAVGKADGQTAYERVLNYLQGGLAEGKLRVGGRIETERELASRLRVSRNSVREALKMLENMGIVESRQGSGNYLTGNMDKGIKEALSMFLLMKVVDKREVSDLRRAIELHSYMKAIYQASEDELRRMRTLLDYMESEPCKRARLDREFHDSIVRIGANSLMISVAGALSDVYDRVILDSQKGLETPEQRRIDDCHRRILRGFEEKDAELGAKAIMAHYDLVKRAV